MVDSGGLCAQNKTEIDSNLETQEKNSVISKTGEAFCRYCHVDHFSRADKRRNRVFALGSPYSSIFSKSNNGIHQHQDNLCNLD